MNPFASTSLSLLCIYYFRNNVDDDFPATKVNFQSSKIGGGRGGSKGYARDAPASDPRVCKGPQIWKRKKVNLPKSRTFTQTTKYKLSLNISPLNTSLSKPKEEKKHLSSTWANY